MPVNHICHMNLFLLRTKRYKELVASHCGTSLDYVGSLITLSLSLYVLHFLIQPFFSIDSAVLWPEVSASLAEFGLGGETIVRSEEGRAALVLSPSGEEFTVEFMCSLSSARNQHRSMQQMSKDDSYDRQEQASSPVPDNTSDHTEVVRHGRRNMRTMLTRPRSCSPQMISDGHQKVVLPSNNNASVSKV